jgi:ketosteroid isomerase-like protein
MAEVRPGEVVSAQFATFAHGGLDEAVKYWHPEIEWRAIEGAADDVGVICGTAAIRRHYQEWVETMADLRFEVDEIVYEDDERVVALVRISGRGRVSGVSTSMKYYVACLVEDGRIVAGREYATGEEAVAAAGSLA